MKKEQEIKDDIVSTYVKSIQATPTLTGDDAVNIIKQILTASSPRSVSIHNHSVK